MSSASCFHSTLYLQDKVKAKPHRAETLDGSQRCRRIATKVQRKQHLSGADDMKSNVESRDLKGKIEGFQGDSAGGEGVDKDQGGWRVECRGTGALRLGSRCHLDGRGLSGWKCGLVSAKRVDGGKRATPRLEQITESQVVHLSWDSFC